MVGAGTGSTPLRRAFAGRALRYALLSAAAATFVVAATTLVRSQMAARRSPRVTGGQDVQQGAPSLLPVVAAAASSPQSDVETVLAYATTVRDDDPLVEVQPGVMAKRSNVAGVVVRGRTLYYDSVTDQSFGPLRTGRFRPSEVVVLARVSDGGPVMLVYARRSE